MENRCGIGTRCGNISGIKLGGFFVPGANGLPDLYVHADDPTGWVQMQISARQASGGTTAKDVAETAAVGAASNLAPDWAKKIIDALMQKLPNPKEYFKGVAVAGALILLAILLIVLGGFQLIKSD